MTTLSDTQGRFISKKTKIQWAWKTWMRFCCWKGTRHMGHWFTRRPQGRQTAEWPHEVITESMGFSMQMTHSSFWVVLVSAEGRAVPHERQTVRDPKFVSGHDGHFQSPGFIATRGGLFTSMGSCLAWPHLRHAVRTAKLIFLQAAHVQSPGFGTICDAAAVIGGFLWLVLAVGMVRAVEHRRQAVRDLKFTSLHCGHFQSPGSRRLQRKNTIHGSSPCPNRLIHTIILSHPFRFTYKAPLFAEAIVRRKKFCSSLHLFIPIAAYLAQFGRKAGQASDSWLFTNSSLTNIARMTHQSIDVLSERTWAMNYRFIFRVHMINI